MPIQPLHCIRLIWYVVTFPFKAVWIGGESWYKANGPSWRDYYKRWELDRLLGMMTKSVFSYHITGKFGRPLNLAKRSESATYIFGDLKFWQNHIALPRVHTHTSRAARQLDIIIIILLANLKFGNRLFDRQIAKLKPPPKFPVIRYMLLKYADSMAYTLQPHFLHLWWL